MKGNVSIISVGAAFALVGILGWKAYQITTGERVADRERQQIPTCLRHGLDGTERAGERDEDRSTVVVFFTTTCEFCVAEIEALKRRAAAFGIGQVVLVSPEDALVLQRFQGTHELENVPQIRVMRDTVPTIGARFRIRRVPTILVYGPDGTLTHDFEGVTPIEEIVRAAEGFK